MLVSAFGARLRKHLTHLWGNFSEGLQRKKQKGTDLEIKRESIIQFCNFMHSIFRFTKTEFSFPWGLLSRYPAWSGSVRSILCWFYGWEDENCSEIAVVVVSWGTTEFLFIHFFWQTFQDKWFAPILSKCSSKRNLSSAHIKQFVWYMYKCIYCCMCKWIFPCTNSTFFLCLPHPGHKSQHLPVTLENSFAK